MAMRHERRPLPPLDTAALERMALRYVERFATTRGRLADYLQRKIRERGWQGEAADPAALAQRMADLGYVNDHLYAESKAAALTRRGLGARRVTMALRQAGIGEAESAGLAPADGEAAMATALAFARRKRIGPFGPPPADRGVRDKQLAALLRAGHAMEIARKIVACRDEAELRESG